MYVLGLTGPSGAGKSTVAGIFARRGWAVVDADKTARAAVAPGSECLNGLAEAFGRGILRPDGSLDRKALAKAAFADEEKVKALDRLTHPYIVAMMKDELAQLESKGKEFALLDAPALYEAGADNLCDGVLAVISPRAERLERIKERDGMTPAEAERRLGAQHDDGYYTSGAQNVIVNDGTLAGLEEKTERLADKLEKNAPGRRPR